MEETGARFFKYAALAAGIQCFLFVLCLLIALSTVGLDLMMAAFYFYSPVIFLMGPLFGGRGESSMMAPFFLGIPAGVIIYSLLISGVWMYFTNGRQDARS